MTTRTRTQRAVAADLIASSQRLMDELLEVEDTAFGLLDAGMQRLADATRERIHAAHRLSPVKLKRAELLPDDQWIAGQLLPPISQLIAVARERALSVANRQMQIMSGFVGAPAAAAGRSGRAAVGRAAPEVERLIYMQATDMLMAETAPIRASIVEQRRIWLARHESLDALVARVCSSERVGLPGATRGAVWPLRARMHAAARSASVDTANALLIASMRGWNDVADAA